MKDKAYIIRKVLKSKSFVYTDDQEAMMLVDFGNLSASLQLLAITNIRNNLNKIIKEMHKGLFFADAVKDADVLQERRTNGKHTRGSKESS
jgi:hypothetical protein